MALDHLANLNTEQRRAVEHGVRGDGSTSCPPLFVIAGAGSGKIKALTRAETFHATGARLLRDVGQ